MKIPCSIIKDLLPLYIEEMEREESKGYIEEHLFGCEGCKKEFLEMQKSDVIVSNNDIEPLKKIKTTIRKRKIRAILVSVVLSLTCAFFCFRFVTKPRELPYEENLFSFATDEYGVVTGTINRQVSAWYIEGEGDTYHISAWIDYLSKWKKKNIVNTSFVINKQKEPVTAVYYSEGEGTKDILIYGKEVR